MTAGPVEIFRAGHNRPHPEFPEGFDDDEWETPLLLPETFWSARSTLTQIRQAAHSRTRSADVVFHSVLARIAGAVPHTLKLPAIVGSQAPLCYFVGAVGPPGSGKSSGYAIAGELVPVGDHVVESLPVGSGEGMVEVLFDMVKEKDPVTDKWVHVKRQMKHNAIIYIDEGDALTALGAKSGATAASFMASRAPPRQDVARPRDPDGAGGHPRDALMVATTAKTSMSESELLDTTIELAELFNWRCVHFRPGINRRGHWQTAMSGTRSKGFPDCVFVRERLMVVEFKSAKGKLTDEQATWMDDLVLAGLEVHVWRPAHWEDGTIESVLRRRAAQRHPVASRDLGAA